MLLVYLWPLLIIGVFRISSSLYSLTASMLQAWQDVYLKACIPRFVPYWAATGSDCVDANPATHFTGFFPDELSGTVAHGSGLGLTSPEISVAACTPKPKHEDKDPFTSPGAKVGSEQKLSATASTFQPFSVRLNQSSMHPLAGNRDIQRSDTVKIANRTKETANLWDQCLQPTTLPLAFGSKESSALIPRLPALLEYLESTSMSLGSKLKHAFK